MEPRRPVVGGWVREQAGDTQDGQRWSHPETGLVAVSSSSAQQDCLAVGAAEGARCGAALAFMALADFGMLQACEDPSLRGPMRVFRLSR
jgi:hypothetical protein